jgi:hypothetical protein
MKSFVQSLNYVLGLALAYAVWTNSCLAQVTTKTGASDTYLLQYKLRKGETVRWDVEHHASTKTRMAGESEETSSRSVSRKAWKVIDVDDEGNMTFSHSIEAVDMWQKIGDDEAIAYNSKSDEKAPYEYEATAARLGKTLAELKVTPDGLVKERKTDLKEMKFGVGDITVPLPKHAIPIGQIWNVPTTLNAVDEDKRPQDLKARLTYQLVKVTDGHAYITFKTEILTPVESPKIESQLMQQKTKGYLVFDIQNGRMVRKDIEWNEKVQGFEGDDSFLEYVANMSEKIVDEKSQQTKSVAPLSPLKPEASSGESNRVGANHLNTRRN